MKPNFLPTGFLLSMKPGFLPTGFLLSLFPVNLFLPKCQLLLTIKMAVPAENIDNLNCVEIRHRKAGSKR